jgi:hypothetical protein
MILFSLKLQNVLQDVWIANANHYCNNYEEKESNVCALLVLMNDWISYIYSK